MLCSHPIIASDGFSGSVPGLWTGAVGLRWGLRWGVGHGASAALGLPWQHDISGHMCLREVLVTVAVCLLQILPRLWQWTGTGSTPGAGSTPTCLLLSFVLGAHGRRIHGDTFRRQFTKNHQSLFPPHGGTCWDVRSGQLVERISDLRTTGAWWSTLRSVTKNPTELRRQTADAWGLLFPCWREK